jgi:hypothetical protein
MEINRPGESNKAFEKQQRALIDASRARVRAAREDLAAVAAERSAQLREARADVADPRTEERRDEILLSSAARESSDAPSEAEREARVRELTEAHRMERLHTPERIERAAQRLLQG